MTTPNDMHDFSVISYLKEINQEPQLTADEEKDLFVKSKAGDFAATTKLTVSHLKLVVKIAREYSGHGLPVSDLIAEGNIGLMEAINRFDTSKGVKLSTYASYWIKQKITRSLANKSKVIRLPVHLHERLAKIKQISYALSEKLGGEPSMEELAIACNMPLEKLESLINVAGAPTSLDAEINEDGGTVMDFVPDQAVKEPDPEILDGISADDLNKVLKVLSERETTIVNFRFGLHGGSPHTLEETGERFEVTKERVRQIQNVALKKMRKAFSRMRNHIAV